MEAVTSKDGTKITYEQFGSGAPVILISGGSVDRSSNADVANLLAAHFTVINYDRRGRGESGDTLPYAVQREIEDMEVLIDRVGGAANVYGTSSGAALGLEMAAALPTQITRLGLYEPPYIVDAFSQFRPPANTAQVFHDLVAEGRRGDAAEFFMSRVVGMPPEFVAQARSSPWWHAQEALAHTLEYDATVMGDYSVPSDRFSRIRVPTLIIDGGASFPFMKAAADAIAASVPNSQRRTLEGQQHNVDPAVLVPVLTAFFAG